MFLGGVELLYLKDAIFSLAVFALDHDDLVGQKELML